MISSKGHVSFAVPSARRPSKRRTEAEAEIRETEFYGLEEQIICLLYRLWRRDPENCWTSHQKLVLMFGVSGREISRALQRLRRKNEIYTSGRTRAAYWRIA